MKTIQKTDFLKDMLVVFLETFEGTPEGQGSAYLDRGIGIFPTLEKLSAADASRDSHGTTIAAQTEHADRIAERS